MITIDVDAHRATAGDRELTLTRKEFTILATFAKSPGRLVSREALSVAAWGLSEDAGKTLDMHLSTLRRKLGNDARITTVRGVGYRLDSPARFTRLPMIEQ